MLPATWEYSTMYHDLPARCQLLAVSFFRGRGSWPAPTREQACPCGGRLHSANYRRKPRGGGDQLPEDYGYRLSFCCDREGCRKRATPPSVRFLGRKVYLFGVVVILVAAMRQGPSPQRVRELSRLFGADRRTIARWQVFWRERFPQTAVLEGGSRSPGADRGARHSAEVAAGSLRQPW